jgi:type VI protein secretion system component Hcp
VTLDYGKIEWQYQPVLPNGTLGTPVKGGWDVRQNRKI